MSGLSINDPVKLYTLFDHPDRVIPGDVIVLRGGVYDADLDLRFSGTSESPVTLMGYGNERAVIDGEILINSNEYLILKNLELRFSGWKNRNADARKYLTFNAPRCKVINCYIHDLAVVGFWASAVDSEFYGNVIANIGWFDKVGYGHSLYTQNTTGRKLIKHNIMLNSFNFGVHAYATGITGLNNFDIIENTIFNSGLPGGVLHAGILIGSAPSYGSVMNGNLTYGNNTGFMKYQEANNLELSANNNYFPDGWIVFNTTFLASENNTVGTVGNRVFLYPNDYDPNRANLTIYNQVQADNISVDVSSIFDIGNNVNAHNVQDYYNDIQKLTVVGHTVTVNMQAVNRSVATPIGLDVPASTFPQFGCFVLERV